MALLPAGGGNYGENDFFTEGFSLMLAESLGQNSGAHAICEDQRIICGHPGPRSWLFCYRSAEWKIVNGDRQCTLNPETMPI